MKRILALILAALMLASSTVACGNGTAKETEKASETKTVETAAPATDAVETNPPETESPAPVYPYDTSLITENGVAKAHIVLADTASADEKTAADELVYHIKLVTGADVTVTNTAMDDSLPIIIATPDSLPELEELFPEDLAWLRTRVNENPSEGEPKYYAPDGFAIRQKDGKLYIFGTTAEGALNGTYDFIEDILGVLWIKTTDDGIIYDEMPTVTTAKADYREKSPFTFRYAFGTQLLDQRNKHDTAARAVGSCHNVIPLLTSSPTYDPNITEYWETDQDGNPYTASTSRQVNYWSELTADTIADSVIMRLDHSYDDTNRPKNYTVSQQDLGFVSGVYPEKTLPFEYAPGQFIEPDDPAYLSTVYFTFINRVAKKVAEKYPDVYINTLAYDFSTLPPVCELEKNVMVWYCPYNENYTQDSFSVALDQWNNGETDLHTEMKWAFEAAAYDEWVTKHPDTPIFIFDYYFCHYVGGRYERPIWYRVADDFRYYAETGCLGTYSCLAYTDTNTNYYSWQKGYGGAHNWTLEDGYTQLFTYADAHAMNLLSQWLFYKLTWNPYEDVDALIQYFCDKVYGEASDEMQEYYSLLYKGWKVGEQSIDSEYFAVFSLTRDADFYHLYILDNEVDGVNFLDGVRDILTRAYEAADDRAKEFIRYPYEIFSKDWTEYIE